MFDRKPKDGFFEKIGRLVRRLVGRLVDTDRKN